MKKQTRKELERENWNLDWNMKHWLIPLIITLVILYGIFIFEIFSIVLSNQNQALQNQINQGNQSQECSYTFSNNVTFNVPCDKVKNVSGNVIYFKNWNSGVSP